jgi:hypothetical protein
VAPHVPSASDGTVRGDGWVRDPLEGWTREDGALAGALGFQYALVAGAGLVLELGEVGQAGVAAQVAGAVDDGLDPQRAAVPEAPLSLPQVLTCLVCPIRDRAAGPSR